ncbi:MAG TPA: Ig-like domain-containing protein [Candidatus Dormibacteraeota bacterium]|nr:Ig-like domain-containing protein [Candidatus Dormibacteraeota bacterium]
MSAQRDHELDGIGAEHGWTDDDYEVAQFLRRSRHLYSHVEPSPQFRQNLQRRLMREAWEQASRGPLPWYRRVLSPQPMAWAGAAVGVLLIVVAAFFFQAAQGQHDQINVHVVSPQQNAQLVSTATPIEMKFSQPMDTSSVQVQVQPATQVKTEWQGNTLKITPVYGLQGNTQYTVHVAPGAQTATHQPVGRIQPVTFSTGPVPTPTPSPGPTPTTSPTPVLSPHAIAPIGAARAHWSADGSGLLVIGPNGQLQLWPVAGGSPQKLADGATLVAVAPDGSPAWVSGGQVTWKSSVLNGVSAIALGFRQSGALLLATANDVETADQKKVALFKETADAVDFSPSGDRLVYRGASGIHVVDLSTGRDTLLGAAGALGDWSNAGRRYAYVTDAGVSVADTTAGTTSKLVDLTGVTGISWSAGNQLLLSTSSALYLATYTDGSPVSARKLQDGTFAQPQWAPAAAGAGVFSFRRSNEVWVAKVQGAIAGGPITAATPGISQSDLVSGFMEARKNGDLAAAQQFLDQAGQTAFSRLDLVYTDPTTTLARYYVLLSQPGRAVVRLVLAHGGVQTAMDETLTIQPNASGNLRIHDVNEAPRPLFATGPEVVSVVVTQSQVKVVFDSDLDPSSATQQGAVGLRGVTTASQFDSKSKTVTLTVPGGLTPGQTYDLVIDQSLQDVNQRRANPYDLTFTGPPGS